MVQKDGKLKVPIPQEFRAPVGDHASQLVSKIGVKVRTHLPDFSIRRWKHVNEEVMALMFQRLTDNMIKIQAEHCSEPGAVPITPEELSVKVLKPRSGYVKGLGLRRSFSVRTTSASTNSDYVRHLEMEIQEQKKKIQSQKEEIQSHKEEITAQKHEIQVQKEEIQAQNKEIGKINSYCCMLNLLESAGVAVSCAATSSFSIGFDDVREHPCK
ncbi:hypothetical protein TEA_016780 [Camellia sinensis var. sinensis]|uniref:Uncharacterized protein n=1 Tax=Camellia sinensis var. sinensis TaxID=542762 RepID=A0A4S4ECR9_CAMSN|nr:hypothetical protein TEA_016780 [Camellia sinensis var. sinensis]